MPLVLPVRYLEIASQPLAGEGFCRVADLTPLLEEPPQLGDNRHIPDVPGTDPYAPIVDQAEKRLRIEIFGENDHTGAAHSDGVDGVERNVLWINANIVAPTGTGDGTRVAVLHLPSGNRTGNVQVRGLELSERKAPNWIRGILTLVIPAGRLS